MDIMVIAGTADGRQIIDDLLSRGKKIIATVTTDYGKSLIDHAENLQIIEGKLNEEDMLRILKEKNISILIDASHPYAKNVSANAINACKNSGTKYIRFERDEVLGKKENIIPANDYAEAARLASGFEGNIFLTTGSNSLEVFISEIKDYKTRLFARVLPMADIILKCESLGLTADNIIALKGPFSEDLNIQMLKHCNAKVMVTKDSGTLGGTGEKFSAADKLNIPVILVKRPEIDYGIKLRSINEVMDYLKEAE